ncbi:MAG: hypothetical protein D3914_08195 [Candidatus Electrothrix sp. LOE2]|nr:hypothetical protein [Candidatus Electrothrix sp. LOE2]
MDNIDKLNEEVQEIYKFFMEFDKKTATPILEVKDVIHHPSTGKLAGCYVGIPLAITVVMYLLYLIFGCPVLKLLTLLAQLASYAGFIAIALFDSFTGIKKLFPELKAFITNPLITLFEGRISASKDNTRLLITLRKFSLESLQIAQEMIEQQRNSVLNRIAILTGALDKVGLLPGLASLYFAMTAKGSPKIAMGMALAMSLLYLLAFVVHDALPRLGGYLRLLKLEINRRDAEEKSS